MGSSEGAWHRFTSNPAVGFWVGIAGIVIGAGLSMYFYFISLQFRRLVFFVDAVRTEIVRPGEVANLHVFYGDQELKNGVSAAQVAVWNAGNLAIKPENILNPIQIVTHPAARIIEAKITKVTNGKVVRFDLDSGSFQHGVIPIKWAILEENDGARIQVIYEGPRDVQLSLEGAIEGQRKAFAQPEDTRERYPRWIRWVLWSMVGLYVPLLFGMRAWMQGKYGIPRRWDLAVSLPEVLNVLLLIGVALLVTYFPHGFGSAAVRPPF